MPRATTSEARRRLLDETSAAFFRDAIARHRVRTPDAVRAFFAAITDYVELTTFHGCVFQNAAVEHADPAHPAAAHARDSKRRFRDLRADLVEESVGPVGRSVAPAGALLIEGALIACVVNGTPDAVAGARDAALVRVAARNRG